MVQTKKKKNLKENNWNLVQCTFNLFRLDVFNDPFNYRVPFSSSPNIPLDASLHKINIGLHPHKNTCYMSGDGGGDTKSFELKIGFKIFESC
jgi:hypothetical protein